jgi:hypothetical protein
MTYNPDYRSKNDTLAFSNESPHKTALRPLRYLSAKT